MKGYSSKAFWKDSKRVFSCKQMVTLRNTSPSPPKKKYIYNLEKTESSVGWWEFSLLCIWNTSCEAIKSGDESKQSQH